jgi:signal peptidase I
MTTLYTTSDFFRDNYWLFDKFLVLSAKIKKVFVTTFKSLLDSEIESDVLRIVENLPYGVLIFYLGFFLTIFLLRVTETNNGMQVFRITTASMAPKVQPGSLLFSYPANEYKVGDIVTYEEKNLKTNVDTGRILTHRIVERRVENGYFIYTLKGDNNENPDPGSVRTGSIMGKVFLIVPYMGYIDFLITTVPGFIILIAIPSILLVIEAKRYLYSES